MVIMFYFFIIFSVIFFALPTKAKKSITKFAATVALAVAITILFGGVFYGALAEEAPAGYYPRTGIVVEIDQKSNTVTVEDGVGLYWVFEGVEDYATGDVVAMLLWDNNTPYSIYDDIIVVVYYSPIPIGEEVNK